MSARLLVAVACFPGVAAWTTAWRTAPRGMSARAHRARVEMTATADAEAASSQERVVMKFGGSSLADHTRVDHVAKLIRSQIEEEGADPIVVLSAMGKSTNLLLAAADAALEGGAAEEAVAPVAALARETCAALDLPADVLAAVDELVAELTGLVRGVGLVQELSPALRDRIVSFGERISVRIVSAHLRAVGVRAAACDSWTLGLVTSSEFGNAEIDAAASYAALAASLARGGELGGLGAGASVPVVTGFIAHDARGRITTLGRGGSDLTATVLGASVGAREVQVWKDVNGMLSADPRVVADARPVPYVSFEEASELAYFGANILHPVSMHPAMEAGVPVRVKNSYNPQHPGTVIAAEPAARERAPDDGLVAITSKDDVTLVDVVSTRMLGAHGFLARVFDTFARRELSVDVVATSEVSVSLTLDRAHDAVKLARAAGELSEIASVEIKPHRAIVSFVKDASVSTSATLAVVYAALRDEDIEVQMISQGASKVNISLVVSAADVTRAVQALHRCFFLPGSEPTWQ